MENEEKVSLNDVDLEQVNAAGPLFDIICKFIENGEESKARKAYKEIIDKLSDMERKMIRFLYHRKFGGWIE